MTTRIDHLNCATMRPPLGRLTGGRLLPERLVAHCLLVEGPGTLTLVDTGLGSADVAAPGRLGPVFVRSVGAVLDPTETAVVAVRRLGHRPEDVTDVVVTHLDPDHAGGLADFPRARVHVHADELAATRIGTARHRARYRPAQWAHGPRWVEHHGRGEEWFGLSAVPVVGSDVLLVPLPGHTAGHSGVAVRRPGDTGWLLACGDSYFSGPELDRPPRCPAGLRAFQTLMAFDHGTRKETAERLRDLHARAGSVTLFSAHDEAELAALAGAG